MAEAASQMIVHHSYRLHESVGNCAADEITQWKDRRGKKRSAEVTEGRGGELRIKTEAATWTAKYRDGEGVVREPAPKTPKIHRTAE